MSESNFQLANKAFDLMTLLEREAVLKQFSRLRYPSIADRFFDAVHTVIETGNQTSEGTSGSLRSAAQK